MSTPAPPADDAPADLEAARRLLQELRRSVVEAVDRFEAESAPGDGSSTPPRTFSRPAAVPPRRMEQMTRTPEPTADLDDLVDVLVPRLVEHLVPALREALRDER